MPKKKKKPEFEARVQERGTPETRRKLKRGTLQYLIEKGKVSATGPEIMAADEIGRVFGYVTSGLISKNTSWERIDRGYSELDPRWFEPAWKRYKEWADEGRIQENRVCIDIVWNRLSARECDRMYNWGSGTAQNSLLNSLRRYALIAQWVRGREAEEWRKSIYGPVEQTKG